MVPGSLLGKALTAQAVFNNKFLLPFAPDSPEFFLVPGDNQVTVLWRPSKSEDPALGGDPFFTVAKNPTVIDPVSGTPVANPLYDPNYRQFDVEGYRIYRGRVDAPNALHAHRPVRLCGHVDQGLRGPGEPGHQLRAGNRRPVMRHGAPVRSTIRSRPRAP